MPARILKGSWKTALAFVASLPLLSGTALGQIALTAAPTSTTLPDGRSVSMWGYTCGTPTVSAGPAAPTCVALKSNAGGGWSPVVITVPTGTSLTINLTNNLSFANGNAVPTSLTIVGQLGGGLGTPQTVPSPAHPDLGVTWPVAGVPDAGGATFVPPSQGPRVQSFGTEVAAGTTTALTWSALRPGTYLLESGTHPSIQAPMGLYGIVVVTAAPTASNGVESAPGSAYPGVTYDAEVPLLFSEIDPVQNTAVNAAVNTAGFQETKVWSGQPGGCGDATPSNPAYQTCYPPAVNYSPLYYMVNGAAFDKTSASSSLFPVTPAQLAPTKPIGSVLVRMVNAGLRMHVPSIVGSQTGAPTGVASTPASGFSLIAEDGNPLPGTPRVQNEVFLSAGKTYDVMINGSAPVTPLPSALAVYDRELSLSANATSRDAGMLAYISINGSGLPPAAGIKPAVANPDSYLVVPGVALTVGDPGKGLIANDVNVYGVRVQTPPAQGTLTLNPDGTFTYIPNNGWTGGDSFVYRANGNGPTATVTLGTAPIESANNITMGNMTFNAQMATYLRIPSPGVLAADKDASGYPLTAVTSSVVVPSGSGLSLQMDASGGFTATVPSPGTYNFTYSAINSQGTVSSSPATVTLNFPPPSNLAVSIVDGSTKAPLAGQDYRWIIEEDKTFYVDPNTTTNTGNSIVPTYGTNFHTSHMPFVARGCTGPKSCAAGQTVFDAGTPCTSLSPNTPVGCSPTAGQHVPAVCDLGNGKCRPDTTGSGEIPVLPSQVSLDPTKRYYISVLPGDAGDPFITGCNTPGCSAGGSAGHGMGGATIAAGQTAVTVISQPSPYPTGQLSVFVFEDDFPLNGEQDAGGGVDVLAPNEPGLGGFQIHLWDAMGGNGDFTGQMTYDMFNQPLTNSLQGTLDPVTGFDSCYISAEETQSITGMIVTCPKYEVNKGAATNVLSPLAGQAVINNLMPGRFGVIATPAADRIARGEEWHQTNTLDGQKAHDSFIRIGEPSYFQEFGPAGYHVTIGFANPATIQSRLASVCAGTDAFLSLPSGSSCNNTVTGNATTMRMSRTPDERLYSSGSHDSFYWTQCYASLGDPDGEDFAFTKCDDKGAFKFTGIPPGDWRVTIFDQWNDMLVDGLSTPVGIQQSAAGSTVALGDVAMTQWQANLYTRTFIDDNRDGVAQASEGGIPLIPVAVRYRDGSLANGLSTDFTGAANFNETFPLFNWYVVETDTTRYKNTGTHVVYDSGGPADGTVACGQTGYPPCGQSIIGKNLANTNERNPLPANLRVPGSVYCATADCTDANLLTNPSGGGPGGSTGRVDSPWMGGTEGWQGFSGQNNFVEFGKEPYVPGETGGIKGHVVYASTRPFDDPQMLVQTQWEPLVPNVTVNLYQESTAPDGTTSLTLVDTTQTSSWDAYAQGFRADGVTPNMNCPGQSTADAFYFTLYNQPNYLNVYDSQHGGSSPQALPYNSQYKCYDGMHNWNQLQPAPYDGMYKFPSVTAVDSNGKPTASSCTICKANTVVPSTDLYYGSPMLPAGKYVVEVVPPAGFEIVKEEDKNILIGDNFIAPVTQEFGGLGSIFILPDQAEVAAFYNQQNAQNPTTSLGASPSNGLVPGFIPEPVWPCVGEARVVPDYISLFPLSQQVAPFAGATRHLCDRKEVTLSDQAGAIAKFYIFTPTHVASKFTGVITDDFTAEFDPFSPEFGEKFAPPDLPVSVKDWSGAEISRVYADHWGIYDGLTYSSWEVNPPNPTGYSPTMMVMCMNDPGTGSDALNPRTTPDPLYNPGYSNFCYELPYMPGQTAYLDTPVVPTSAFSAGYNHPDCAYPDATPAISEVDGDGKGPWVSAAGKTLTITALGNASVTNYGYSGPSATSAPFNQKTTTRHYGFGGQGTVTIGGVMAPVKSWSDSSIVVTVPTGVPACALQQQIQYGGSPASCGEVVITTAAGKQSVDAVTVTIGGKAPTYVTSNTPLTQAGPGSIQQAIDAAAPGDLIMIPQGTYKEMLIVWKPVRLQGVGAASTIIDANAQPAGKLDPWRQQMACLFGLALNGTPITGTNPFNPANPTNTTSLGASCPGNMKYFSGTTNNPQVDRLPLEGLVGWDTTTNGNLAQLLQEPTLLGAYEGAGITIVSKGVNTHGRAGYYGSGAEAAFPTGSTVLTGLPTDCGFSLFGTTVVKNPYPSNFQCNPSRIDGLTVTDSSQGGGGIFAHAWAHNLEVANNRVYGNIGTLSGGINIGQGESPDAYLSGQAADTDPGSCQIGIFPNQQMPYCFNLNVNVHHNMVTSNTSIGDELFSGTPAGAGGVTFCSGSDYYNFKYNWICGNQSTGDGGGVSHLGFSYNGDIEHNTIIFNQSTNPTISTNGGGLIVMGAAPDGMTAAGVECGNTVADADCPPGLPDGTGPNLVINANLIMGNAAESGSGGGIRLQSVNGTDATLHPATPGIWNHVTITNNIIANNVAGWDGAGVSLQDALSVDFVNNTVSSNDSTASAGVLFNTLGSPVASAPGATNQTTSATTSAPQPAGLVSVPNSANLGSAFGNARVTCPSRNPNCTSISNPYIANDLFWQNRSFYIGVGAFSPSYQQNVVSLFNASFTGAATSGTPAANQPSGDATTAQGTGQLITGGTGACTPGASYWDIGIRGDSGPNKPGVGTLRLSPQYSVLSDAADYSATLHNTSANPNVLSQYCNGSRTPPEYASGGYQVPPGISDATVPNPIFNLSPSATVDEGNNWVNISWGPLAMANPVSNTLLGNYGPSSSSSAINYIPSTAATYGAAPSLDYYGNARKTNNAVDAGAIEYVGNAIAIGSVTGGPLAFGNQTVGSTSAAQTLTLHNTGTGALTGIAITVAAPFAQTGGTCTASLNAGATCTISLVFSPTAPGPATGSVTISGSVPVTGSPVTLSGTGVAAVKTLTITPANKAYGTVTRGATQGVLCIGANVGPCQIFTIRNTGNLATAGMSQTIGSNTSNFFVIAGLTSCGATLNAGAACTVTVQFRPPTSDAANSAQNGNLIIGTTNGFPSLTANLSGTAR